MNPRITGAVPVCFLIFTADAVAQDVIDVAARLIGRPYVWGAEGPNSFDCSGLTQYVYQQFGVELPRRAISQSQFGDAAGKRLRRGDLLFFSTDTRKSEVTHVGLYEGNGVMIDASKRHGRVRRDDLSDDYWAERFMFARRVAAPETIAERRDRPRDRAGDARPGSGAKRETTERVLRGVAEILFDRMRRR